MYNYYYKWSNIDMFMGNDEKTYKINVDINQILSIIDLWCIL